ncbi:hypothetical protein Arub01_29200 [Actinomadura rubrobrunea]|uniref:Uncharacterized protein n=2 Tax=Actinomadura rubrobrunea TaxID=115335 RepID=A0A9W6PWX1_9ACTN|nr:hypothetical protein Arub01_29200 [Actinomadura rubrobrunea]
MGPGQMPTMPAPGFPVQPPPAGSRKTGRLIALLGGGAVAAVLLVVAAVVVVAGGGDEPDGPLAAGQCIDKRLDLDTRSTFMQRVPSALRVGCKSAQAKGRVLKILRSSEGASIGGFTFSTDGCPDETDGGARVRVASDDTRYWDVCVRNLNGPHPGDPGAGGGMIAAGDCISDSIAFNREVPCTSANWYGKIIARVADQSQCPVPRTMETAKISGTSARPVLCLGAGGKVLGPGDCIKDPTFGVNGPDKADCGTDDAVAKVTGRVRTQRDCPSGSDKYMEAKGAYLPILCLKQLKPTLREQLGGLGRV